MSEAGLKLNGTFDRPGVNETLILNHYNKIPKLMKDIKTSVSGRNLNNRCDFVFIHFHAKLFSTFIYLFIIYIFVFSFFLFYIK